MISDIYFLAFAGIFLFFVMSFFIVFVFMHNRDRQRQSELDKEKMRNDFARELLQTQLEVQEQAFRTISQEIHDNIGQILSIAKMNLGTLDYNNEPEIRRKTSDSRELVAQAIRDLRDLSHTLHPEAVAERGLQASIEYELEVLIRTGSFQVIYKLEGAPVRFAPNEELILLRIFQEAINNAIRHASASVLQIGLSYGEDRFELSVQDNGRGFDPESEGGKKGLGIRSMRNRAEMIGATLKLGGAPGGGSQVLAILPRTENQQS